MVRGSDSAKVSVWRERLERFGKSEVKVKPFCAGEGVSVASFYAWRRKLSKPAADRADQNEASYPSERPSRVFTPIVVNPLPATISIRLPDGVQIDVPSDNLAAVRAVIDELLRIDRVPGNGTVPANGPVAC
jgi:hypothetical protein